MDKTKLAFACGVFLSCLFTTTLFAAEEMIRVLFVSKNGNYIRVRNLNDDEREIRVSDNVVVVSRDQSSTDLNRVKTNTRLQISIRMGEATNIVVEEAPK